MFVILNLKSPVNSHFSNCAKFHRNVKIPWQTANSVARLYILQPAENCVIFVCLLTHASSSHNRLYTTLTVDVQYIHTNVEVTQPTQDSFYINEIRFVAK